MVTAVAATIINSSMVTHSIIITAIVTICVLTVALAPGVSGLAVRRTATDLGDVFHGEAFSTAYLVEGTNRRLDAIRSIGGSRAVEREAADVQAVPTPGPNARADFETFWNAHYRYFLMFLMAIGATVEDAHDTVHDVVVKMLKKDTWSGLTTNPRAWVRKDVLHTYYDQQKRRRRKREIEKSLPPPPGSYVDDGPNVWEEWQWVKQMLSTLPPAQREVVELILADLDASEIADLLGKTPAAIRQNLAHARRRLRANLGKDYR
jgi:RNA polymerase sigma factor (sigma-70 family)